MYELIVWHNYSSNLIVKETGMRISVVKKGVLVLYLVIIGTAITGRAQLPEEQRNGAVMESVPQEQNQQVIVYSDEIKEREIPEDIITSVKENYLDYKITEAFRGSDGSYKIGLEKNKREVLAFYSAGGEFLRIEMESDENTIINDDWR